MEHHVPLSLSLDDKHDSSFADDLILQFDLKRERLYTMTNTHAGNDNQSNDDNDDDNDDDLPIATPSLHSATPTPLASVSRTIQSEEDNDHDITPGTDENSAADVSPPSPPPPESSAQSQQHEEISPPTTDDITTPECVTTPAQQPLSTLPTIKDNFAPSPPAPPTTDKQNRSGLLRRSSTYLRQKFFSAAHTTPPPTTNDDDNTTPTTTTASLPANQTSESDKTIHLSPPTAPASSPPPPCQYPPKPLSYCPVDPPTDEQPRRTSFPTLVPWRKKSLQNSRRQSEPTVAPIKGRRSFF